MDKAEKIDLDHFEKIFALKMISDEEFFATVVDVTDPEYFKDKAIRDIFEIFKTYFLKRDTIPNLTEVKNYLVTQDLKDSFKKVLTMIQNMDKTFNRDELLKNTERYLKERAVYKTMLDVADKMQQGKVDTSWVLGEFEKTCNINLTTNFGLDLLNDVDKLVDDINTDQPMIPSKWKWMDKQLDGGFLKNGRALYVFAGQTNVGKSIVLGNIACNIASQGKTVLLISLEMSEMMYAKRLSSSMTKIPIGQLKTEVLTMKAALQDIKTENPRGRILIKEFPPSTITPHQLAAYIKNLKNKGITPDVIVLDYLNLLHTTQGSNSYERVKHICEQVRAMTYVFNCPCISATQINRCLEVGSMVSMHDGTSKQLDEIVVGDELEGSEGPVIVRHVYPKERKKVYRITTASGKSVMCSETHLFPKIEAEKVTYGCVGNGLSIGDELIVN